MEQAGVASSVLLRRERPPAPLPRSFAAVASGPGCKGNLPHSLGHPSPQNDSVPRRSASQAESCPTSPGTVTGAQKTDYIKQNLSYTPGKRGLVSVLARESRAPRIPHETASTPISPGPELRADTRPIAADCSIRQYSTSARTLKSRSAPQSQRPAAPITPERLHSLHKAQTEPAVSLAWRLPPSETFAPNSEPRRPARIPSWNQRRRYRWGPPGRSTIVRSGSTELALLGETTTTSRSVPAREPIRGTTFQRGFEDRRSTEDRRPASYPDPKVAESPGSLRSRAAADEPPDPIGTVMIARPTRGPHPWPGSPDQPWRRMTSSEAEIPSPLSPLVTEWRPSAVSSPRHTLYSSLTLPSRHLSPHAPAFAPRPRHGTGSCEGPGCDNEQQLNLRFPQCTDNEDRSTKKTLNVESAPFTPAAAQQPAKKTFSSSHAASAAVFTPRASGRHPVATKGSEGDTSSSRGSPAATPSVTPHPPEVEILSVTTTPSAFSNVGSIREFTPQNYDIGTNGVATVQDAGLNYDPFTLGPVASALPTPQYNPYANDHAGLVSHGGAFYPGGQSGFAAPLQPVSRAPHTSLQ